MIETVDEKCARLELEIKEKKLVFEELKGRYEALEAEKHAIQDNLAAMKRENEELKVKIAALEGIGNVNAKECLVDLTGGHKDEDEVFELMAEKIALECEKDMAVKDLESLTGKFTELESRYFATLKGQQLSGHDHAATPPDGETRGQICDVKVETVSSHLVCDVENRKKVKKQLLFSDERSPLRKIAPSTPGVTNCTAVGIIDLVDSDDGLVSCEDFTSVSARKRKRKRPFKIITSDSESESDNDHVPLSKLMRMHPQEKPGCSTAASISTDEDVGSTPNPRRRHLLKLSEKDDPEEAEDNDSNNGSDDSLRGFIVDDSDIFYDVDDSNSEDASNQSEEKSNLDDSSDGVEASTPWDDLSDEDTYVGATRRRGHCNLKWEFEADMLAAFGKIPRLCMEAVCTLYRQQTDDEKHSKGALHINRRGFSKFDALRGSEIAEFLTDGDPYGGMKKSVEELEQHDPKALDLCQNLAARYSKQLFEIYTNKEDPLFCPDSVRLISNRSGESGPSSF